MKKVIATILMLVCTTAALAGDPGKVDVRDYVMDQPSRIQITGELTENSPVWTRWRPNDYSAVDINCNLPMDYMYTNDPAYDMFCFNVADSAPVEFVVDDAGFDTVLYIYCDPFDPMQPLVNPVIFDDDDGDGLYSAVLTSDNVTLTPGNDYWLVICAYYYTQFGTYSIQTSDNVALCGSVAAEDQTWSSVKGLFD